METTVDVTKNVARPARTMDLDALSKLDVNALGVLYARGTVGTKLDALEGHPRGRMLAVASLDHGAIAGALRRFSGSQAFPWGGKSFTGRGESGAGVNRVHVFGRHQLFPFLTRVGPSVVDGAPCIVLDYDLPDNPGAIRSIHDEVREIEPGLYLGPAMWKTRAAPRFILWFALDTRAQATPIGRKRAG